MTAEDRFYGCLREMAEMHDRKAADYGTLDDPHTSVRASADWGVSPWIGTLIRATDKLKRLQKAAQGSAMVNEGVRDSLVDLAVYATIALALWDEENGTPEPGAPVVVDPETEAALRLTKDSLAAMRKAGVPGIVS